MNARDFSQNQGIERKDQIANFDSVNFDNDYKPISVPKIYLRHWQTFPKYVTSSAVNMIAENILKKPNQFNLSVEDAILMNIYLYPQGLSGWEALHNSDENLLTQIANIVDTSPAQIRQIADATIEILLSHHQNQFELIEHTKMLCKEYILYQPVYQFWHRVIARMSRLVQEKKIEVKYRLLRARDLFIGFDEDEIYSLNILDPILGMPMECLKLYTDGMFVCDSLNYIVLLRHLVRLIRAAPDREFREPLENITGEFAYGIGMISWQLYKPFPDDTFEWLKLAWQFGKKRDEDLAYALASCADEAKKYAMARSLFEYTYLITKDPKTKWSCAIRLLVYYADIEDDLETSEIWAKRAHELDPNGVAYDVLAAKSLKKDPEAALSHILTALDSGFDLSRQQAALNVFWQVTKQRIPMMPAEEVILLTNWLAEKLPMFSEFLKSTIQEDLLSSVKSYEAEASKLRDSVRELEQTIEQYRETQKKEDTSQSSDELENKIITVTKTLVPDDREIRVKLFTEISSTYPEALDTVKDTIVDAYFIYLLMAETKAVLADWTAPLVYFAKAVENQARLQLKEMSSFDGIGVGLGAVENHLNNHTNDVVIYFGIKNKDKFYSYIRALRVFRTKYRNGFIHENAMTKQVVEELVAHMKSNNLFPKFTYM
jgi:tetratricopeptide (TPR) repeat protein